MLATTLLPGAEKLFEVNDKAAVMLPGARLLDMNGIGFDRFNGYRFNQPDSYAMIELTGAMPESMTVAMTGVCTKLPEKDMMLFLRPGFHHIMGINSKGEIFMKIWHQNKKTETKLFSKRKIRPGDGRFFRAAFTIDQGKDGKSTVKLYLDGELEAETVVDVPLFKYSRTFYIGGVPEKEIKWAPPGLNGVIRSFVFAKGVMSAEELATFR